MYIIFLGAPGAGKGTQAVYVARKLNLVHLATGDLFRLAIEQGTELGIQIKSYVEKGMLVPNEVTIRLHCRAMTRAARFIIRTLWSGRCQDRISPWLTTTCT